MLEDHIRTEAYYRAVQANKHAFEGKVVLDVGTGTGILSFFAAQAGAKRVYAVEGSVGMARNAQILVNANGYEDVIKVIPGKIEEIELPEKVDVIISEPMGVMLFHERMIESYLYARDKFLKPECRKEGESLFPGRGSIFLAPFTDSGMFSDFKNRSKFWRSESFYGVDLTSMQPIADEQIFRQPVVGGFDPKSLLVDAEGAVEKSFDFCDIEIEQLKDIEIPFEFVSKYTGIIHGIAGWFNVSFGDGITLETGPNHQRTHWQQCRFFFRNPVAINRGQIFRGLFKMTVNDERSYNVMIEGGLKDVDDVRVNEVYALHEQQYFNLTAVQYPEISNEYYSLY